MNERQRRGRKTDVKQKTPAGTEGTSRTLLHQGGPLNARVYRVEDEKGRAWVEKDFGQCQWWAKWTLGRFLVFREWWILRRLEKTGVVPKGVCRVSAVCLREDFCEGYALRDSLCGVYKGNRPEDIHWHGVPGEMLRQAIPASFFEELEAGVQAVHRAGFVHLDLHNARNVMVEPGFHPVIVDWQSAVPAFLLPGPLRRALERIDLAGVWKFREKFRPGELSAEQRRVLETSRYMHRFWLPRLHAKN